MFKKITVEGECEELGEWISYFVVPEHVAAFELMTMEGKAFCECYTSDDADLIVSLLNKEARH